MLGTEYRRTLPELKIRYNLEPNLRDIYVEGSTDRSIIEWYTFAAGHSDVSVYEIGAVNIPATWIFELGLPDNNRSRVIALSLFLVELAPRPDNVFCIADKDFEAVTGLKVVNSSLIYT